MIDTAALILTRSPEHERSAAWGKRKRTQGVLKSYTVSTPDGAVIGRVYQGMVTFDIKPAGSRIVTRRWESPRWRCDSAKGDIRGWWETRKGALEALVYRLENPT